MRILTNNENNRLLGCFTTFILKMRKPSAYSYTEAGSDLATSQRAEWTEIKSITSLSLFLAMGALRRETRSRYSKQLFVCWFEMSDIRAIREVH